MDIKPIKQHITVDQLNELNKEQQDWFIDTVVMDEGYQSLKSDFVKEFCTIGKLFEFLGKGVWAAHNVNFEKNGESMPYWTIVLYNIEDQIMEWELCDTLWEGVKHVIEKEMMANE